MIVESKFAHVYRIPAVEATIKPGINLIPDGVGRRLEAHPHFKETLEHCPDQLKVIRPAAKATKEEEAAEAAAAKQEVRGTGNNPFARKLPEGAVATKSLTVEEATDILEKTTDVEALRDVAKRDARPQVRQFADHRIALLAKEAEGAQATEQTDQENAGA